MLQNVIPERFKLIFCPKEPRYSHKRLSIFESYRILKQENEQIRQKIG